MAELYSKNTSNSEQLKPSKKTIRFLIDYSKSLKIIKIRKTNYEVKITEDGKLDLYTHKTETKEL